MSLLISLGADVNAVASVRAATAFMFARLHCFSALTSAPALSRLDNQLTATQKKKSALHLCCRGGHAAAARLLLAAGADPTAENAARGAPSPLPEYRTRGRLSLLFPALTNLHDTRFSVSRPPASEQQDGFTPLESAAASDDPECAVALADALRGCLAPSELPSVCCIFTRFPCFLSGG